MNLTPEQKAIGKENFFAAIGSNVKGPEGEDPRRVFLKQRIAEAIELGDVPGYAYFGYDRELAEPLRVGVIGTGDEGSVLIGAMNPKFIEVKAIADIRPYNQYRAFHGDCYSGAALAARPGLMKVYDWNTEDQARENVKVYGAYEELLENAKNDRIEAVIIALPLHLHAAAAIAAMRAGLHVLTEKLMGHSVHECKEMARVAKQTQRHLATGHQRHYNILYANAVDLIGRGLLGDLHYIRAQWHRGNLPGNDSWQQPIPQQAKPSDAKAKDLIAKLESWKQKRDRTKTAKEKDLWAARVAQVEAQIADEILAEKDADGKTGAERLGYQARVTRDAKGRAIYDRPAIEELIRWRLWDRTGGGLMVELGSHQLDAASIFIAAMNQGHKQHPLSVGAMSNRPLFPADRDVDDHVFCVFEFPAPGYDARDPLANRKKIGVQYASINGNGYGGYGETVFGTHSTLLLEREKDVMLYKTSSVDSKIKVVAKEDKNKKKVPALELAGAGDPESAAIGAMAVKDAGRGYQQQLEHWAWCVRRNPDAGDPAVQPRCLPKVALGDAVIALTTNIAARKGQRIEFDVAWFDVDRDETPEGVKPDVTRYDG